MSIAIIAEYNPFHNGHIYQIKEAKKRWPNERIIIIMSGKYVQRGELAVASFEKRANIAKQYGADDVIELPFKFATQAAHIFARGAVHTAVNNGATKLFFGSESNNVDNLKLIANTIHNNKSIYNKTLKKYLKQGFSFPKSAAESLSELSGQNITLPNDILGLEYIKTIVEDKLEIEPHSLKRTIAFHSDESKEKFASASFIRKEIFAGNDVSQWTPMIFDKLPERIEEHYPTFQNIINKSTPEELRKCPLISEGMENLFKKHIDAKTFEEFVDRTNSRRYTSSRIKRVMLYLLLRIKK
ncbi:nucleotidyltransferase [Mycoplasma marinum]|uniref:nucleotidyltransferase n=1 Tax=Mycoplasma marinum TaxID=1937190 RepID=UPI003B337506